MQCLRADSERESSGSPLSDSSPIELGKSKGRSLRWAAALVEDDQDGSRTRAPTAPSRPRAAPAQPAPAPAAPTPSFPSGWRRITPAEDTSEAGSAKKGVGAELSPLELAQLQAKAASKANASDATRTRRPGQQPQHVAPDRRSPVEERDRSAEAQRWVPAPDRPASVMRPTLSARQSRYAAHEREDARSASTAKFCGEAPAKATGESLAPVVQKRNSLENTSSQLAARGLLSTPASQVAAESPQSPSGAEAVWRETWDPGLGAVARAQRLQQELEDDTPRASDTREMNQQVFAAPNESQCRGLARGMGSQSREQQPRAQRLQRDAHDDGGTLARGASQAAGEQHLRRGREGVVRRSSNSASPSEPSPSPGSSLPPLVGAARQPASARRSLPGRPRHSPPPGPARPPAMP